MVDPQAASLVGIVSFTSLLAVIFVILIRFGAARLSWCYNISAGTGQGVAFIYAFLAFCFSDLYYPYYAYYVDPSCK
jgi:hypothetical protein